MVTPKIYYNDNDKSCCAWLKELMHDGLIPKGEIDQRSITEVRPKDLRGYHQCHFFAGIGGWSLALRLAAWPEDREVWTGSCPCQPFSVAGKGKGFADERHLWPAFSTLIRQCRPATVFGEQVGSKLGRAWLSGVCTGLEGMGYGFGAADLCAAGIGAPHIRQRLYWVANSESRRNDLGQKAKRETKPSGRSEDAGGLGHAAHPHVRPGERGEEAGTGPAGQRRGRPSGDGEGGGLADAGDTQRWSVNEHRQDGCDREDNRREEAHGESRAHGEDERLADPIGGGRRKERKLGELQEIPRGASDERMPIEGAGPGSGLADASQRGQRTDGGASGESGHAEQRKQDERVADRIQPGLEGHAGDGHEGCESRRVGTDAVGSAAPSRAPDWNGPCVWWPCRDGVRRRIPKIESLLQHVDARLPGGMDGRGEARSGFPLTAEKIEGRVMLLRGAGNAISPPLAAEFVKAFMETEK